jgi:hypothetical protein
MRQSSPSPAGKLAIVAIFILGAVFFAGLQLSLKWLHNLPHAPHRTVIVLPASVEGPPQFAYFSEAWPDTVNHRMGQVPGLTLRFPPRIEFDRVQQDVQKIAGEYKATACVTSSLAVKPAGLVLDVRLIETSTQNVSWKRQFTAPLNGANEMLNLAADEVSRVLQ